MSDAGFADISLPDGVLQVRVAPGLEGQLPAWLAQQLPFWLDVAGWCGPDASGPSLVDVAQLLHDAIAACPAD